MQDVVCAATLQNRRKGVRAGVADAYLLLNLNPNLTIVFFFCYNHNLYHTAVAMQKYEIINYLDRLQQTNKQTECLAGLHICFQ